MTYRELKRDFEREVKVWVDREFQMIPTGLVAQAHRAAEEGLRLADGTKCEEVLELVAAPERECTNCGNRLSADDLFKNALAEVPSSKRAGEEFFVRCPSCEREFNGEEGLPLAYPEHAYPAAWGWMAHPSSDGWFKEHLTEVSALGFYVYDGAFGLLLGIDAGGFDFYEAFWAPLYRLFREMPAWHGRALTFKENGLIALIADDERHLVRARRLTNVNREQRTASVSFSAKSDDPDLVKNGEEVYEKDLGFDELGDLWVPVTEEEWKKYRKPERYPCATPDHLIHTENRGWVRADELTDEDKITEALERR